VNNAGIAIRYHLPPSQRCIADIQATYDVNVFGPVRVTQAFLPPLLESPAARIVMVSSYSASIEAAFAKELAPQGVKVNAAAPGYTATDLNGHRGRPTVQQAAEIVVRLATLGADGPTAGYFDEDGLPLQMQAFAAFGDPDVRKTVRQSFGRLWRIVSDDSLRCFGILALSVVDDSGSIAAAMHACRNPSRRCARKFSRLRKKVDERLLLPAIHPGSNGFRSPCRDIINICARSSISKAVSTLVDSRAASKLRFERRSASG
jgi:hypothetical protein